jgi:hypothetical protein
MTSEGRRATAPRARAKRNPRLDGSSLRMRSSERKEIVQISVLATCLVLFALVPRSMGFSGQQPPEATSPLWHFEAGG